MRGTHIKFLAMVVALWFGQYVFIPYFTPHLTAMGLAGSVTGLIVGSYGFTQLCLRIPCGIGADRLQNHKIFMAMGFVALSLAGATLFFAGENPVLHLIGRMLGGVSAATWVNFTIFYSDMFSGEEGSKAIGYIMVANNLGTLCSYLFGMAFYERLGIRALFAISGVMGVIGLVLLLTTPREKALPSRGLGLSDVIAVIRDPNLLYQSLLAAILQLVMFATALSFTANYARKLGAGGMELALLSVLFSGAGILGSYWMSTEHHKKITYRAYLLLAFLLLGIYCVMVPNSKQMIWIYVAQVLVGIGRAILLTVTMAFSTRDIHPDHKTTAMGVYQSFYSLGIMAGPILMGFVLDQSGSYHTAFYCIAGISALGGLLSLRGVER